MFKKTVLFLSLLLVVSGCSALKTSTAELAVVLEVNEENIVVENMNNRQATVQIPKGIHKLIEKNKEYFVVYEHFKYGKRHLTSIEPSEKEASAE